MTTLGERILEAIKYEPLDDDVLAARLGASSRQTVNQTARRLELAGRLHRHVGPDGKIVNERTTPGESTNAVVVPEARVIPEIGSLTSEDEVKESVRSWLTEQGFAVAMGRERGIDIDARHRDGRRWVIEAKGAVASDQQQGNYFLGAIGELLQRMADPNATYALALPNNRRYRGLVRRLPALARQRIGLVVLWVDKEPGRTRVTADWTSGGV